jgi:hypothetical protein
MFWIDAGILFAPEAVFKLLQMKGDIAVGACQIKQPGGHVTAPKDGASTKNHKGYTAPLELDAAGCGFMCNSR